MCSESKRPAPRLDLVRGPTTHEALARDLAVRLAGAVHSRRLYATRGPVWEKTLTGLKEKIDEALASSSEGEVTFARLADGLAVCGVPILDPPSSVLRLAGQLEERDVEIIAVRRGCEVSELEALLELLGIDAAEIAAVQADSWLRDRGVEHVTIKHLRLMRGEGVESFRDVFWRGKRQLGRQLERAKAEGVLSGAAVTELARSLYEVVLETKAPVATLLALRDRDDFTVVHSVNVGILVGAQAAALGIEGEEAEHYVLAGLMHDIGKTRVPDGILSGELALGPKERALLDRHTVEGARILLQTSPNDRLLLSVAMGHHAPRGEGEGLLALELVRIADVFDGVRTLRPFDDRRSARGALTFMHRKMAAELDPFLLERFAALIGMFEPGDHARLDTGEIVRIVDTDVELAFHPKVEVLDKSSGKLPRGHVLDLAAHAADPKSPKIIPTLPSRYADLEPADVAALG